MRVCVLIFLCVCLGVCIFEHIFMRAYVYQCYICVLDYSVSTCMRVSENISVWVWLYMCLSARARERVSVCASKRVCILLICVCTYMCMFIGLPNKVL